MDQALPNWKWGGLSVINFVCVCVYTGVEGCRGNLEARRVRNAENEDDVEGVSKIVYFVITTINIANDCVTMCHVSQTR